MTCTTQALTRLRQSHFGVWGAEHSITLEVHTYGHGPICASGHADQS